MKLYRAYIKNKDNPLYSAPRGDIDAEEYGLYAWVTRKSLFSRFLSERSETRFKTMCNTYDDEEMFLEKIYPQLPSGGLLIEGMFQTKHVIDGIYGSKDVSIICTQEEYTVFLDTMATPYVIMDKYSSKYDKNHILRDVMSFNPIKSEYLTEELDSLVTLMNVNFGEVDTLQIFIDEFQSTFI